MTQPLALLFYEKLLPGSQVVNRLQDEGWRVHTVNDATSIVRDAEQQKPIIVVADLGSNSGAVTDSIRTLRQNPATMHIPVIAYGADESSHKPAADAGATLVVSDTAILQHLIQFIDQALSDF
jgi:CheY-like chemotaxis protein